jgi:soluble lytic murein transglycosylase-like protein
LLSSEKIVDEVLEMLDIRPMALNMAALILAIAAVETGDDPTKIGAKGEVSQYQISKAVWRQHSPKLKFNPEQSWSATAVATKHIRYLNAELDPSIRNRVFWIAVAWNGGLGAVNKAKINGEYSSRHVAKRVQDYGDRVRAMYHVYEKDPRCMKKG